MTRHNEKVCLLEKGQASTCRTLNPHGFHVAALYTYTFLVVDKEIFEMFVFLYHYIVLSDTEISYLLCKKNRQNYF